MKIIEDTLIAMFEFIVKLITIPGVLFFIWLFISWIDVITHNSYPGGAAEMWKYNCFLVLM